MKDIIAEMRPKTQGVIRDIFRVCANGGASQDCRMDAYIDRLAKDGLIKYRYITKGTYAVGVTLTRKGIDACLSSKCTRDIRTAKYGY